MLRSKSPCAEYRSNSNTGSQDALASLYGNAGRYGQGSSMSGTPAGPPAPPTSNQLYLDQLALANRSAVSCHLLLAGSTLRFVLSKAKIK